MPRIWALLGSQSPIYNKNEETFTSQGRTIWPDFSRKQSRVTRTSVTLTARLSTRFPPTWLGSYPLQKHLFCHQNQDLGRLIFLGQWRAMSLEVYIIFSACLLRPQTPQPLSNFTFPWLRGKHFPLQHGVQGRGLKPNPGLRDQVQLPQLPQAAKAQTDFSTPLYINSCWQVSGIETLTSLKPTYSIPWS